jgi:hypothetical protein
MASNDASEAHDRHLIVAHPDQGRIEERRQQAKMSLP